MFAWVITMFKAIGNLSEYNDARNSSKISAPQISQISGEYVVSVLPWLAGSLALTSLAVVIGVGYLLTPRVAPVGPNAA